ncbi:MULTISPECIES: exodeoxyribonuclease V subunit beta [unclassified Achromobacter]|uniref:exodeoxyribonuclease V subunit beta n=1 Tax=unclassified Achromobacter TaxID=2626865 RepID=UPI000B518660|nr:MULTISPECIES: exodeoxyribonuclease V subunit beta [unclassified Achromobacter]OWT74567.1 exodeoxyribonuclease V subunit beta [Achromobacter sp. HZ34]OWT79034.1 exodeoxyribonuclease V subunit beta [Achromobacter sp. HZ28]
MARPERDTTAVELDVLRFPLRGSRLIEASAGTGKTYTIATLYVRLVLGHGGDDGLGRPLVPPEILVVTFTDAATQELRDRIRVRLADAARVFLEDPEQAYADADADADADPDADADDNADAPAARTARADALYELRAEYPPEAWGACARKLQLAVEWMDEAAVSTIHGWCNRMLREHAFDSDSLFQQTLEQNSAPLLAEAARDYWRVFIAGLDSDGARELRGWWVSPDALQQDAARLFRYAPQLEAGTHQPMNPAGVQAKPVAIPPPSTPARVQSGDEAPGTPSVLLATARATRMAALADLKAGWPAWITELRDIFDAGVAAKKVDGRKFRAQHYNGWLNILQSWCEDPENTLPGLSDAAWQRLSPEGMDEAWKGDPPDHPACAALAGLREQVLKLPNARNDILKHAAAWMRGRYAQEQARRAQMDFDDLLGQLDRALAGPNGAVLATAMRQQFPVALIDEFQDTDPVQYRIFDAVYRLAENPTDCALILIGDPKQAIYGFRGADIYTYLRARAAVAGRLYALKTNFRSTHAMVSAANHCFEVAEHRPEGEGAFLFRTARGNPVPFTGSMARGRADRLVIEDAAAPALTTWWLAGDEDGSPVGIGAYREQMAAACASEIARLMALGQQGRAGFANVDAEAAPLRPLRPADMAVLVNSGREARVIRKALAQRGVRSVYLSENQSVYLSPQAADIEHWLRACAEPDDPRLLRAALATPTLGLSWAALDSLNSDEWEWDRRVDQFRGYGRDWRTLGVLPMLRRLMDDFDVPARQRGGGTVVASAGERALTDLLHIAELLQQASVQIEGEHALLRHLAEMRAAAEEGEENDALTIRLESDADLLRVVTVHKSKGLEYPLVFLPFAMAFRPVGVDDLPLAWHDGNGEVQVTLEPDEDARARADRERLGEDLRKFYVALTRARYATWLGCAPIANAQASALGYLLKQGQPLNAAAFDTDLKQWRGDHPDIAVAPAPESRDTVGSASYRATRSATQEGYARQMSRGVREHWWVASYSALRTVENGLREEPATAAEDVYVEAAAGPLTGDSDTGVDAFAAVGLVPAGSASPPRSSTGAAAIAPDAAAMQLSLGNAGPLHGFPAGAEAGTFFHELLEWAAAQGFGQAGTDAAALQDAVMRRCQERGWEDWAPPLADWLRHFLVLPLALPAMPQSAAPGPVALADLDARACVSEMEFWFAAHDVAATRIDRLVCAHVHPGRDRAALAPARLNGMLKGFIDLVFEFEGRYYVADYKSNRLGPDDAAYDADAMLGAMLSHRYELQYVLYLLALHRLLRARIPDYDYDRHIGGAVYLFLRGSHAASGGVYVDRPARALIEGLDALFTGHGDGGARPEREAA